MRTKSKLYHGNGKKREQRGKGEEGKRGKTREKILEGESKMKNKEKVKQEKKTTLGNKK